MDKPNEHWKEIPGWEGLYEVSDRGRIRSLRREVLMPHGKTQVWPGKVRKQCWNGRYWHVSITRQGVRKTLLVHHAVAAAFIGPRPSGRQVNHKDGNRVNNNAANLEYVTAAENTRHAYENGLSLPTAGESHGCAKLSERQVLEIIAARGKERAKYLAVEYGVSRGTISDIWRGRSWKHLPR